MKVNRQWLQPFSLLVILMLGLVACGDSSPENTTQADSVRLSDQDRVATVAAQISQQETARALPPATATPITITYDPGPYFTSSRSAPEMAPDLFVPPDQVADFTRQQTVGNCGREAGQLTTYTNGELASLQLTCFSLSSDTVAQNTLADLATSSQISAEPLFFKLQGTKNFLLGNSGNGFIYAWTHENWLFIARSPKGRDALDSFMQGFPY